jgi:hypothetical protein
MARPDGTGVMCGGVTEASQHFSGPAVDPDRAIGKAMEERQRFKLRNRGIDEFHITGTVARQHAGEALWRHRKIRHRGLQEGLRDPFAARNPEQLIQ